MGKQTERFGALLRRYREAAAYSQEELAERAGLSKNAIGGLERGERLHPYPDTIRRLAAALGLNDDERRTLAAAAKTAVGSRTSASGTTTASEFATPSLPQYAEGPIGREREIKEALRILRHPHARLLTFTGAGGVGKTRLAVEVSRRALTYFADGVFFAPLALLQDPTIVIPMVAQGLGLREAGTQNLREILYGYLRDKEVLLVLDNFEHLLEGTWEIADLLLACPHIKVVATSRAPLRLQSEQEYLVQPLGLPNLSHASPPFEEVAGAAAVRFFVRRARQASSAFALTPSNALALGSICHRLDGLPLAIELAAARVKVLPPAELLARLDYALPLLTGGARDMPERQQTMSAAISWSYELLTMREKRLFQRLSVFSGGWTLEAAEGVGADVDEVMETDRFFEAVYGLADQSLIVVEQTQNRASRYRMLEPIRQYAAERLEESGGANATRKRHATYYLQLAEQGDAQLREETQLVWLDRLEEEHANLRLALIWHLEQGESQRSLRLAGALGWFWFIRGYQSEGRKWLERALASLGRTAVDVTNASEVHAQASALALHRAGMLAWHQGDISAARQHFEESLALSRTHGDMSGATLALACLAAGVQDRKEYPALRVQLEECVALAQEAGDIWVAAFALSFLGHGLFEPDPEIARSRNEESVRLFRQVGDRWGTGFALMKLGEAAISRGEYESALAYFQESLSLHRELQDGLSVAVALTNLGEIARLRGDNGQAQVHYQEALARFEEVGDETDVARVLHNLGRVARQQGDSERAAVLLGKSLARFRQQGFHRGVAECAAGFAGLAIDCNNLERAAVLLGWVEARFQAIGTSMWPADRAEYDHDVAVTNGRLSVACFTQAWATGSVMTYDEALTYILTPHQPYSGADST